MILVTTKGPNGQGRAGDFKKEPTALCSQYFSADDSLPLALSLRRLIYKGLPRPYGHIEEWVEIKVGEGFGFG